MANEHVAPAESQAGAPVRTKRPSRFLGQYIVKNRFQFKFSFIVFIFLAVAASVIWLEGHLAVRQMIDSKMVTSEDAIANLKLLNSIVGKTAMLAVAITFGLALFFSHFIAGPIYRFEKTLEEMRSGNLSLHVRIRKHDEFRETADLFNQTLASLRVKIQKERDLSAKVVEEARKSAAALRAMGRSAEADALEKALNDLKNTPPQIQI